METETKPARARWAGDPDEEIVRRVREGETALFEILMRRHNPRIYRAIRSVLRDEAEAEDAMQSTYLRAFASLREFAGHAAFSTWLTRIAVNEALGRLRKGSRLSVVAEVPEHAERPMNEPPWSPEERVAAAEAMRLVEKAVDGLPVHYRTVFVLRDVEQLSTAEAAQALGVSEEAVKIRLHRARAVLRNRLADEVGRRAPDAFPFLAPRCDRVVGEVMAAIRTQPA